MSKTLHIHGIFWTAVSHRNGETFHHEDFSVATDDNGMSHVLAGNGPLFSDEVPANCLRVGTDMVLDDYASRFVTSWDAAILDDHADKFIPIWEEV